MKINLFLKKTQAKRLNQTHNFIADCLETNTFIRLCVILLSSALEARNSALRSTPTAIAIFGDCAWQHVTKLYVEESKMQQQRHMNFCSTTHQTLTKPRLHLWDVVVRVLWGRRGLSFRVFFWCKFYDSYLNLYLLLFLFINLFLFYVFFVQSFPSSNSTYISETEITVNLNTHSNSNPL